jgi:hypothetical protein
MVCFQTKYPNLGKFWRALDWVMFILLWPLGISYGDFGYFMTIWYIFSRFEYQVPRKIWQPCWGMAVQENYYSRHLTETMLDKRSVNIFQGKISSRVGESFIR